MADREKIIRAVATCFDSWIDKHRNMGLDLQTVEQMKRDALELLKEQEPVQVIQRESMHMLFWCCGSCGVAITDGDKFCRMCGREVKWGE